MVAGAATDTPIVVPAEVELGMIFLHGGDPHQRGFSPGGQKGLGPSARHQDLFKLGSGLPA
ncbi:hypothetical protein GCM10011404_04630 [Sphingomonas prati]|nr:hypothetical protein GCM10011404_04630 [Sphingomonas prati]